MRPAILITLFLTLFAYTLMLGGVQFYPSSFTLADTLLPSQSTSTLPAASEPVASVPDISKTPPSQVAIRDKLLAMLSPTDPNSVFTVVDSIEANKALALSCHEIAHDIGHKAYELYGFSGAMNFTDAARLDHASVQDICAGGYVHGVLEEAALHQSDFKQHPGEMCEQEAGSNRSSCFHGVGHALMFTYYRDTSASLEGCRTAPTAYDASRCFEGVWMEFFWGNTKYSGPDTLGWQVDKPLDPCIATNKDAKPACFVYSTFGYLTAHPHDYTGAIQLCTQSALAQSDADYCLKGVGITMISHFKAKNLEQAESYVAGLPTDQKYAFYQGVMGYAHLSGISRYILQNSCNLMTYDTDTCLNALSSIN